MAWQSGSLMSMAVWAAWIGAVVPVSDADHALRPPVDGRTDLAVVDLLISGGTGLDVCRTLAADGTPVLAVSTLDMQDAALDAGAEAFLLKPLDPLRLVSTVRDLLPHSAYLRGHEGVHDE